MEKTPLLFMLKSDFIRIIPVEEYLKLRISNSRFSEGLYLLCVSKISSTYLHPIKIEL